MNFDSVSYLRVNETNQFEHTSKIPKNENSSLLKIEEEAESGNTTILPHKSKWANKSIHELQWFQKLFHDVDASPIKKNPENKN